MPFFFEGGTVLCVDRGDVLFPLIDRPSSWVVLVLPDFGVSTREAYRWWDDDRAEEELPPETGNDLERPVAARHRVIARAVMRLRRLGSIQAGMSGSGSAVFGLFESERKAGVAARAISGSRVAAVVTRTLSRRQYRSFVRPR